MLPLCGINLDYVGLVLHLIKNDLEILVDRLYRLFIELCAEIGRLVFPLLVFKI